MKVPENEGVDVREKRRRSQSQRASGWLQAGGESNFMAAITICIDFGAPKHKV